MADISMCKGTNCPSANDCYRFRAIPNEFRQTYFVTPPIEGDKCKYFSSIEGRTNLTPIKEKK